MDYDHIQRVFSDLLLRRSIDVGYRDRFGSRLGIRYLETPMDSDGNPLRTYQTYGPPPVKSPVVGVGIAQGDDGEKMVLLTDAPENFDASELVDSLGYKDVDVEHLRTGRAVATSRPAEGGESLGHRNGDTGTLGCVVKDAANVQYLLSCNHVIAAMNSGVKGSDEVWQPGAINGGTKANRIGVLHDFAHITVGGATGNRIDAAICKPDNPGDITSRIKGIGTLTGVQGATLGAVVQKSGAKTGLTTGKIRLRNLSILVDYPGGVHALFDGQLGIIATSAGDFSTQGDSGSVVVDDQLRAVGLLISALSGVDLTIASPMADVLSYFKVSLA